MNDKELDHLLKEHFTAEGRQEASGELVYSARQKAYHKQERRRQMEWVRPMSYMVLLHLLWSGCLVGGMFVLKGSGMALQALVVNIMSSCIVIIAGCMLVPQIKGRNEEERTW